MEALGDLEIICGAQRTSTQFIKRESRNAGGLSLDPQFTSADVKRHWVGRRAGGKSPPGACHSFVTSRSERSVINRRRHQLPQAEIVRPGDFDQVELVL